MTIWETENKLIDIGLGKAKSKPGNWGALQIRNYNFLVFHITVAQPTLDYLKNKGGRDE